MEEKTCHESAIADLQMEVQSLQEDKALLQTKEQVSKWNNNCLQCCWAWQQVIKNPYQMPVSNPK